MMGMCAVYIWKLYCVGCRFCWIHGAQVGLIFSSCRVPCPLLLPSPRSSPPAQPPALLGPLSSPPPWSPAFKPPSELYHEHGAMYQLHPWLFSRPSRVPGYASRLPSPSCFPPGNSLILAPASVFTTLWLQHLGRRVLRDHLDGAPVGELRAEAPGPS